MKLRSGPAVLLLTLGLATAGAAWSQAVPPGPACLRVPFAQQVDVDLVTALAHTEPRDLPARIAALGIDLKRVPSARPDRAANPMLIALPVADPQLLQHAEFLDGYQGRAIPAGAPCCALERATVLIRGTASTYTLLHEVVHLLVVPADGVVQRTDVEPPFAAAFHRLKVYQARL